MQYRSRCNIFNSFGNALLFRYIYKGRLVQISENIAFLFYKEIYMKYLILYYKIIYIYFILHTLETMRTGGQDASQGQNTHMETMKQTEPVESSAVGKTHVNIPNPWKSETGTNCTDEELLLVANVP
jgi:hypothetical protein